MPYTYFTKSAAYAQQPEPLYVESVGRLDAAQLAPCRNFELDVNRSVFALYEFDVELVVTVVVVFFGTRRISIASTRSDLPRVPENWRSEHQKVHPMFCT